MLVNLPHQSSRSSLLGLLNAPIGARRAPEARRLDYRPDIDGLRALAVVLVVLFHAFPQLCPGGFVGVDVFFVISGFLISRILYQERRALSAALASFYLHRIRRIFPSLLLVLMSTTLVGHFVLLPDEFAELRREALASCAFVANVLFSHSSNYFDLQSSSKPLLHLWSLAIEEQFYLFWPLIVLLGQRWRYKVSMFWALMSVSFALGIWLAVLYPTTAFYSPLTRIWELGLGAWLAWQKVASSSGAVTVIARWRPSTAVAGRAYGWVGLAGGLLILCSAFVINASYTYPGMLALFPTAGAFLIIASGPSGITARLLSGRIVTAIGRISYPLYLWHWPILVFGGLLLGTDMSYSDRLALLVLALILAQASEALLERPVRHYCKVRSSALLLLALMLAFAVGLAAFGQKGGNQEVYLRGARGSTGSLNKRLLTWWFPADPRCVAELGLGAEQQVAGTALFCSISPGSAPISVALIGDSTANGLYPGLSALYGSNGQRVINVGNGTCAPFRGVEGEYDWNTTCALVNTKLYDYILSSPSISTVIWSMTSWDILNMRIAGLADKATAAERFAAIGPLVRRDLLDLTKAGKKVIVTFDAPRLHFDPRVCMLTAARCVTSDAYIAEAIEPYRTMWQNLMQAMPGVCIFYQENLFRSGPGTFSFTQNDLLLYRDDHHLSALGSLKVAEGFSRSICFAASQKLQP